MAKRGNHEGTIYKRKDGLWCGQVTLPEGKRKSYYGKSQASVQTRLLAAKNDLARGLPLPSERQTLGHYLENWLVGVASEIRPSSHRRYLIEVGHIVSALSTTPLARLTPSQVKNFYSQKVQDGLSPTTVRHLHTVLHRALKDAMQMGLVASNVSEHVKAPRPVHHEIQTFSEEQAKMFLEVAKNERFEALYWLALTAGMREGELLALRWQDLDLEHCQLTVRMNLQAVNNRFVLAEPKTTHSRRTIALSQHVVAQLKAHRKRQAEESLKRGPSWNEQDLVFSNQDGGILQPKIISQRRLKRLLKRAGLPDVRFHDLRHTAATIAIARGVPIKVVSEMLGHADISITLRVYAHVIPHMQQAAAAVMDAVFGG